MYIRSITFGIILSVAPSAAVKSLGDESPGSVNLTSVPSTPNNSVLNTSVGIANAPNTFSLQQTDGKAIKRVHFVVVSVEGNIVGYSNDGFVLASYTLNGRFLKMTHVRERLYSICLSEDGKVVLTGGERGLIILRYVHTLTIANSGSRRGLDAIIDGSSESEYEPFHSPIRSMVLTNNERHLVVGLESGEIRILAQVIESFLFSIRLHSANFNVVLFSGFGIFAKKVAP